ncbi:hypothetical protein HX834_06270 [Marine Group I thaumarchaeote]|jgi:hypothetical protein|uniref:Uncharacterized protein n=1 Tax=Marine Group I thaumarchaeote TaxID=2511932 RepID=A0A7K4N0D4_9ARCH|nr:hypothetical protein [Marine Group I thaumarchaeote]PBO82382.1 MAG: hypothetical protein COB95_03875 [Nitrosopumilales archaeon]
MRLGSKTDDEFLIKLNEKNSQIQSIFHEKIKEIAKKHLVDVMMQEGTVKKQETFEVEKINQIYNRFANGLQAWTLEGISSTNDEGIRRNFIKLNTNADDCKISLHLSIQYHVVLFYQPNYEVMKKQKELSDFMDMTKKQEGELTEKSDHVILEKLKAEGYKDLDTQNLFEIFYSDDKIREKIMSEIELQTDGDLQKINQRKEGLLKALDDLLLETYQMEPVLIDEARLVTGEEGCVCNIDIEMIENGQKSGVFDSNQVSSSTKEKISALIDQVLEAIT